MVMSSEFSKFIREASEEKKKEVYERVIDDMTKEMMKVMKEYKNEQRK